MPTHKLLAVEINDPHGDPRNTQGEKYEEYGVRTVGGHKDPTANTVSCSIESVPGKRFRIIVTPLPPLVGIDVAWQLLATVRLNGNTRAEKRAYVLLDKELEQFKHETRGRVIMDGRAARNTDGQIRRVKWAFADMGIDMLLDELDLSARGTERTAEVDVLVETLRESGLEENDSSGAMIEITFERVVLSDERHKEYEYDRLDASNKREGKVDDTTTHTTTWVGGDKLPPMRSVWLYRMYDDDEPPYAVFKFYYRSGEVLRKLGLMRDPSKKDTGPQPVRRIPDFQPLSKREIEESGEQDQGRDHKKKAHDLTHDNTGTFTAPIVRGRSEESEGQKVEQEQDDEVL